MKSNLLAAGLGIALLAACDPGGAELSESESVVPPGAVPAAPDYRPDRDAAGAPDAAAGVQGDTAAVAAPADPADTLTTGPDASGRIRPR